MKRDRTIYYLFHDKKPVTFIKNDRLFVFIILLSTYFSLLAEPSLFQVRP